MDADELTKNIKTEVVFTLEALLARIISSLGHPPSSMPGSTLPTPVTLDHNVKNSDETQ